MNSCESGFQCFSTSPYKSILLPTVTIQNLKGSPSKGHYQELRVALSSIKLMWKMTGNGWVRANQSHLSAGSNYQQRVLDKTNSHLSALRRHGPLDSPWPQDSNIELLFSQLLAWGQTWLAWSSVNADGETIDFCPRDQLNLGQLYPLEKEAEHQRWNPQILSFCNLG